MLQGRLRAAMEQDEHTGPDRRYLIRSLYFDDYLQSGLLDKAEGVEKREKFRIRFYDMDDRLIRLEAKQKVNTLTKKLSAPLDPGAGRRHPPGGFMGPVRQRARAAAEFLSQGPDPAAASRRHRGL